MTADDLIAFLQPHFANATLDAVNQGNKFELRIIGDGFTSKRLVQRQQAVYALTNHFISSGEIHALNIHALTFAEWQNQANT